MIDLTIIFAVKMNDAKTNESTIKTAAPRGALRAFCALRHAASCIPAALTARIPKNNAHLVTIFLISGFIYITSGMVLVKVYVRGQGNMTIIEPGESIKKLFRITI